MSIAFIVGLALVGVLFLSVVAYATSNRRVTNARHIRARHDRAHRGRAVDACELCAHEAFHRTHTAPAWCGTCMAETAAHRHDETLADARASIIRARAATEARRAGRRPNANS